jgi:hydroxymethylglutaryl-CoA synthase
LKIKKLEIASSLMEIFIQDLFYGLIIDFSTFYDTQKEIAGSTFGFLAYGSGSKSKVFEPFNRTGNLP